MSTNPVIPIREQSQCIKCNAPLGQESKDLGYLTCVEHRTCIKCEHTMHAKEIRWCFDRFVEDNPDSDISAVELIHPRCSVSEHISIDKDPTLSIKQSEYDYLNLLRLMVVPNMDLSVQTNENNAMIQSTRLLGNMDWDQKYAHLKMMEACVAQVSIAIAQDKKNLKARADEREKEKFKKAKQQADTSSRPVSVPSTDEKEILLAEFMRKNDIKERSVALKLKRDRDKAINALVISGLSESIATASVDAMLVQQGRLKA